MFPGRRLNGWASGGRPSRLVPLRRGVRASFSRRRWKPAASAALRVAAAICLVLSTLPVSVLIPAPGAGLGELSFAPSVAEAAGVGTITTVAGIGDFGFSGDGGPATSGQLYSPIGVALDGAGNLFIVDSGNYRVRKVSAGGAITTAAGTGVRGFSGDDGPATSAQLEHPHGVALDGAGNLFIADRAGRVRKVSPTGTITTAAGTGVRGFSGDGGPATTAQLSAPHEVAVDGAGNLFIADVGNHRVRKVSATGTITTVAGTGVAGFSGDGGPATSGQLYSPIGVALDGAGNLFIVDSGNYRVRKVSAGGAITTAAGTGVRGFSGDGGPATAAQLNLPYGVTLDGAGNLFISDLFNHRVRKVSPTGTITTVAGTSGPFGGFSGDGGPASAAQLNFPSGVALDGAGNLFIGDRDNNRVRKVEGVASAATTYTLFWAKKARMPTARDRLALAAAGGKLYAIGGSVGDGSPLATVEAYDPSTDTWTAKASMPTPRFNIGAVTAPNGKIYVFGSWQQVEEYDPVTNTWATKASMPTQRFGPGVALGNNGKIYVIGGGNGPTVYSTVEEYDPVTNTWATKASMPTPRYNLGVATAANGKIYAVGGFTGSDANGSCCPTNVLEEYDPATNTWAARAPALTARSHVGLVAAHNGRLYMPGGPWTEEYDPAIDSWKTLAGMPTPRWAAGVAMANNGKIYAIGGGGPSAANEEATLVAPPAAIAVQSGNNQTAAPGAVLSAPLVAKVTDAAGNPVPGAKVAWAISSVPAGGTGQGISGTGVAPEVLRTVPVGDNPRGVAVDPQTNRVYVTNYGSATTPNTLMVLDGFSAQVLATRDAGLRPWGVAVNPTTNRVYIAQNGNNKVAIQDGDPATTAFNLGEVIAGTGASIGVGVIPSTNRVYVSDASGNLSVIDGATNTKVATIVGLGITQKPAVNPTTNKIYVMSGGIGVQVIDGASNTKTATVGFSGAAWGIGVNSGSNKVYAGGAFPPSLGVIDGASNTLQKTVPVAAAPFGVVADPHTNRVYAALSDNDTLAVVDGASDTVVTILPISGGPEEVAVNPQTGLVYVANGANDTLSVVGEFVATTDAAGLAQISAALGDKAGSYTFKTTCLDCATTKSAGFTASTSTPANVVAIQSGNNQMTAKVTDVAGNPVAGVPIAWRVSGMPPGAVGHRFGGVTEKIAFAGSFDGPQEIYVANIDGTGRRRVSFTGAAGVSGPPSWSPDGTKLAFSLDVGGDPPAIHSESGWCGTAAPRERQATGMVPRWRQNRLHIARHRDHPPH